jgi:flagellin-like protein
MKAITPIIAIIILLLITVALSGAAWTFMSSLSSGYTQKAFQPVDSFCAGGFATMVIKNVGTDPIEISDTAIQKEPYVRDSDTVALYHMDGDASDETGGNPGTLNGGIDCNVQGKFGSGCDFDGNPGDFFCIDTLGICDGSDSNPTFDNTFTERTVEMWFRANDLSSAKILYEEGAKTTGMNIYIRSNRLYTGVWYATVNNASVSVEINPGQWYHVISSYINTSSIQVLDMYLDGVLVNSTPTGFIIGGHSGDDAIGAMRQHTRLDNGTLDNHGYNFDGIIDEFRVYGRYLTQGEMLDQQGWGYTCSGSGTSRQCGDITVTKTSGPSFNPHFGKGSVSEGETVTIKDPCVDETCKYRIITTTMASTVTLNC